MKPLENVKITNDWLQSAGLQKLFEVLSADENALMVAGGAVRNALMGELISDIDLATTHLPQRMVELLEAQGIKTVPTGIEHGTITAVLKGETYEITTLRQDIETDGRHAVVSFGTDWEEDAKRRDLTMNGLYCNQKGEIFDFVDGYQDAINREVKFIGDSEMRIKEDALRIMRFFRFFAHYGKGRPEAQGLKACAKNKDLLENLSVERVWSELKKLLAPADPGRALLWMRTTGILNIILPESEKWGIDLLPFLVEVEQEQDWQHDPMQRLMAIVPNNEERMGELAKRLSLSNAEKKRLEAWAGTPLPSREIEISAYNQLLYGSNHQAMLDVLQLEAAKMKLRDDAEGVEIYCKLYQHAKEWETPSFPIAGSDLIAKGFEQGAELGTKLKALERQWIESDFKLTKEELLEL